MRDFKSFYLCAEPPEKINIVNDKGEAVEDTFLGPFMEGSQVNITCVSSGGTPVI